MANPQFEHRARPYHHASIVHVPAEVMHRRRVNDSRYFFEGWEKALQRWENEWMRLLAIDAARDAAALAIAAGDIMDGFVWLSHPLLGEPRPPLPPPPPPETTPAAEVAEDVSTSVFCCPSCTCTRPLNIFPPQTTHIPFR